LTCHPTLVPHIPTGVSAPVPRHVRLHPINQGMHGANGKCDASSAVLGPHSGLLGVPLEARRPAVLGAAFGGRLGAAVRDACATTGGRFGRYIHVDHCGQCAGMRTVHVQVLVICVLTERFEMMSSGGDFAASLLRPRPSIAPLAHPAPCTLSGLAPYMYQARSRHVGGATRPEHTSLLSFGVVSCASDATGRDAQLDRRCVPAHQSRCCTPTPPHHSSVLDLGRRCREWNF
jgi:hypothetical protein